MTLAETLAASVVHGAIAAACPAARRVPFDAIERDWAREAVANSHVLVLDGVPLSQLLARARWPRQQRLLVLTGSESTQRLGGALDAGAAVLCLAKPDDLIGEPVVTLVQQLGSGLSVGEAVRWLHRHEAPARFDARLYGDPGMRFVRPSRRRHRAGRSRACLSIWSARRHCCSGSRDEAYAEMLATCTRAARTSCTAMEASPDRPRATTA